MSDICKFYYIRNNVYLRIWRNWQHQMIPASEYVLPNSKYRWISDTIMFFEKFLQQIPHFESFFHIIVLLNKYLAIWILKALISFSFSFVIYKECKTWFISIVCKPSPRVKMMAWFWFSGLPSPNIGGPGSFIL